MLNLVLEQDKSFYNYNIFDDRKSSLMHFLRKIFLAQILAKSAHSVFLLNETFSF